MRFLVLFLALVFVSCGSKQESINPISTLSPETRIQLESMRNKTLSWSLRCENGGAGLEPPECNTDNSVLWSGLLCASGSKIDCEYVARSQSKDGRWWRYPSHADSKNSFSRDMALGVMLYLVTTKDKSRANSWLSWIRRHDLKLCTDATDDRCLITPNLWNAMWYTWKGINLNPTQNMELAHVVEDSWLTQEAKRVDGFRLHLVVIQAWIRALTGRWNQDAKNASRNAYSRFQSNAFFALVAGAASQETARLTLSRCTGERPNVRADWMWQRTENVASMGWDCIFIANLLLK